MMPFLSRPSSLLRYAALSLSVLTLIGCSSSSELQQPAELVDFKDEIQLKKRWSVDTGSSHNEYQVMATPALEGSRLYTVDSDGEVLAIERDSGDKLWDVDLDVPVNGSIGANASKVFVGTFTGELIALSVSDGSELWRKSLSSEVISSPVANASTVLAKTVDGRMFALATDNGEQKWVYEVELPVLTQRGSSQPVILGGNAYATFDNGRVAALELSSGGTRWEDRVALPEGRTELERMVDPDGGPLVAGDVVFTASHQGRLMAFARGTGRPLWAKELSSSHTLTESSGVVFVVTDADVVQAYSAYSGELIWENKQLTYRNLTGATTFDAYVAVADAEGYLHVLSTSDGRFVAREKIDGSGVFSTMITDGSTLYVWDASGDLTALYVK